MRRLAQYGLDLSLVLAASIIALALRENFELSADKAAAFLPYVVCTLTTASVMIPLLGLPRTVWRYSTMNDFLHIAFAAVAIVLGSLVLAFGVNRLEGVARSIPFVQAVVMLVLLVGARVVTRIRHADRREAPKQFMLAIPRNGLQHSATLIVGVNRLTELFLHSAREFSSGEMQIAGLIGKNAHHIGRLMHRYPILGTVEHLPEIIRQQQVHGVIVDRIVVTDKFDTLSAQAQAILFEIERSSDIRVEFLAATLGFETSARSFANQAAARGDLEHAAASVFPLKISDEERHALGRRLYWRLKRALDVFGAIVFMILLAPVIAMVAALVLLDLGLPVVFWQQRPGLGGRPFKVYKFRTMGPSCDGQGHPTPEHARTSHIGLFLRRTRLDELPQLVNILAGQMSFVGPRPLLPIDQSAGSEDRLLVRPGLSGWAQVKGGRHLSAQDKAALDIWYVRNASFAVDCEVILRTLVMLVFGDRLDGEATRLAWEDIRHTKQPTPSTLTIKPLMAPEPSSDRQIA